MYIYIYPGRNPDFLIPIIDGRIPRKAIRSSFLTLALLSHIAGLLPRRPCSPGLGVSTINSHTYHSGDAPTIMIASMCCYFFNIVVNVVVSTIVLVSVIVSVIIVLTPFPQILNTHQDEIRYLGPQKRSV